MESRSIFGRLLPPGNLDAVVSPLADDVDGRLNLIPLRLLFLTNYYPPYGIGGYEQWCEEVALELTDRGHLVSVLSSRPPDEAKGLNQDCLPVHRVLHLEVESGLIHTAVRLLRHRKRLEQENLDQLRSTVASFRPDMAVIWGMWNVPRSVPALMEQLLLGRVVYYLCDYWPSLPSAYVQQWEAPSARALTGWSKKCIGRPILAKLVQEPAIALRLDRPVCVSRAVRDNLVSAGVPVDHARIIYGGTQINELEMAARCVRQGSATDEFKLLYIGRLTPDKGAHTVIRALSLLRGSDQTRIRLDIVGGGDASYETKLRALAHECNLGENITFRGSVPRSQIPVFLAEHDALIFPSLWDEPFARTVLEAMGAGLVVIGTTTGGTGEVLVENETGLTFPAGDAAVLAAQIQRLLGDSALGNRLAEAARQCVRERFTFKRMADDIESLLQDVVRGETNPCCR